MPRYKRTPEERARLAKIAKFARELGYTKYDYRNKSTNNSRSGHRKRHCAAATATSI